jgi:hypothetical protein
LNKINLIPVAEYGGSKKGTLNAPYSTIVETIFEPNATELDDPETVKASWGFKDEKGRKAFIWCYKFYGEKEDCKDWSVDGDSSLLVDLFGDAVFVSIIVVSVL